MRKYKTLGPGLVKTADAVKQHLITKWGMKSADILVETEVNLKEARSLRPTFHCYKDAHFVCVEVSESAYPIQIDTFVSDCHVSGLPVKLWVAMPDSQKIEAKDLARCNNTGVGILLVGSTCQTQKPAVMLSLAGVRNPDSSTYPSTLRQTVDAAYDTFMQGNPVGACQSIYSQIELVTRKIAIKAAKKGYWKKGTVAAPPDASLDNTSFKNIAKFLHDHFDPNAAKTPGVNGYLIADVVATAGHRNDVSHEPKTAGERQKRDSKGRTRFESACDTLRDLANAAKPMKVL